MIKKIPVLVTLLPHAEDFALPVYATDESAGMDLQAAINDSYPLKPGTRHLIPTGLSIEMPKGFEGQIRSRSGLALNHGIIVFNAPGTIDSDYRGELKIILFNQGEDIFVIERGMKIAQFVLAPLVHLTWHQMFNELPSITERGAKGFGSTGL